MCVSHEKSGNFCVTLLEDKSLKAIVYLHAGVTNEVARGKSLSKCGVVPDSCHSTFWSPSVSPHQCLTWQVPFDLWSLGCIYHCSVCMSGLERILIPLEIKSLQKYGESTQGHCLVYFPVLVQSFNRSHFYYNTSFRMFVKEELPK